MARIFFDKIAAVNLVYFLSDVEQEFRETFRVLKERGLYVLSYAEGSPDRTTKFPREKIENLLSRVGFDNINSTSACDTENGDFYCTTARKPNREISARGGKQNIEFIFD